MNKWKRSKAKVITAIKLLLTVSPPWSLLLKCSITSHFGRLDEAVDPVISFIIERVDTGDLNSSRITFVGVGWRNDEHRRAVFRKFAHASYMFHFSILSYIGANEKSTGTQPYDREKFDEKEKYIKEEKKTIIINRVNNNNRTEEEKEE